MATDVAPVTPDASAARPSTTRAVHRRRGWLLVAAMLFNLWLWGTRINNLVEGAESFSAAFVAVHAVLYVAAIAVAVVVGVIGVRMLREARRAKPPA